ncbi:hypothetical protein CN981_21570 [Priestia megaterium]|nr:hypothetical protein CN981_21570 [Priestia megaterium]
MFYSFLVNIMSLSGRHAKKESLGDKDSSRGPLYRLYSFLYILDMKGFLRGINKERRYKKAVFYTYASPFKLNTLYYMNKTIGDKVKSYLNT